MGRSVPTRLKRTVWWDGDALCMWVQAEAGWRVRRMTEISVVATCVFILLTSFTFGLGALTAPFFFLGLGLGWTRALSHPKKHRVARFRPGTIELVGPHVRHPFHQPRRVIVEGELGERCRIRIDDRVILDPEMTTDGAWTPDSLTWFAKALARQLEVPLVDERPLTHWRRWAADPVYRACVHWDRTMREAQSKHPDHYAAAPAAVETDYDHHGMRIVVRKPTLFESGIDIRVDRHQLTCGDTTLPLDEIVRAGFFIRQGPEGEVFADFEVLARTAWKRLFTLSMRQARASGLQWLSDVILEEARKARVNEHAEEGSAKEIPSELRAMVSSRRVHS